MQQRRRNEPQEVSPRQVAVHFAMGALLGTLGAVFLVLENASRVHQLFWRSVPPPEASALFIAVCALTFAFAASLGGGVFSTMGAERIA